MNILSLNNGVNSPVREVAIKLISDIDDVDGFGGLDVGGNNGR
jgi:hypothetical protein